MRTLIAALEVLEKFFEDRERFIGNEKVVKVKIEEFQDAKAAFEKIKTRLSWSGIKTR